VQIGVHLPQTGRAASAASISRCARQAEELGFADVWVSDHVAVPDGMKYPPAFILDPVSTLTWAAAATTTVGLGTSVLVLPYRQPVVLAKQLSSLCFLAGSRLTIGAGAGWLAGEFAATGVPFAERERRTDEYIDVLRACWAERPISFQGEFVQFPPVVSLPQPAAPVPIWVGGAGPTAIRRAVAKADGWHGYVAADALPAVTEQLRAERPEEEFTLSNRVDWDGLRMTKDELGRAMAEQREAGMQHVVAVPSQSTLDEWMTSVEHIAAAAAGLK
jgi:probable F420-dependent oxidoreductase